MATTIVYPSIDVSGTASVSTLISTAGTFAGSLTASTLAVTGTSTFSGTAVFLTTAQFLGTVTFSASVRFLTAVDISGTASVGFLKIGSNAFNISLSQSVADGQVLSYNNTDNKWRNTTNSPTPSSASYTAAAIYVKGTATFSGTAAFLTAAKVSGTLSVGTMFKIAGSPAGLVQLGSLSLLANASIRFSGSWSDYALFALKVMNVKSSGTSNSMSVALYTDGGTTPILSIGVSTVSSGAFQHFMYDIHNNTAFKVIYELKIVGGTLVANPTATANTGIINCIQVCAGASVTLSGGFAILYGMRH